MEYIHAAILLSKAGKQINEENMNNVLSAAGIKINEGKVKSLVAALEDVNIDEAIKDITLTANVQNPSPTAAPKEAKKEEKKDEKKEEEAAAGLGALFG